ETTVPLPRSRKVDSFRTGLPLRIMEVGPRKKGSGREYEDTGQMVSRPLQGERPPRGGSGRGWCERGDSNPHALRHWYLKPGRLPIPPLSRCPGPVSRQQKSARLGRALRVWWAVKDSNLGPID